MTSSPVHAVAVAVAALTLPLAAAVPAVAATWSIDDDAPPRPGYGDIVSARVSAGAKVVRLRLEAGYVPYETLFFIDVDPDRPGPEFAASRNSDTYPNRVRVYRVDDWSGISDKVRCNPTTARLGEDSQVLTARFALGCLKIDGRFPSRLRVNVATNDDAVPIDAAPARHRFGRWFSVG